MRPLRCLNFKIIAAIVAATTIALLPWQHSSAQAGGDPTPLYITMHTAPIDNYCAPCMASEKLLKAAGLEFRKILEPQGPWPWFQLTDSQGNQRRLSGAVTEEDIERIKKGQWPERAR